MRASRCDMISCSCEYSGPSHSTENPCFKRSSQLAISPNLRNMHISYLAYLLPLAALVAGQDTNIDTVKRAFTAADIPGDLTIAFNPTALLEVSLSQATGAPIVLHAGIQVPRDLTAGPPIFNLRGAAGSGPFVIATVDPDAPTPQAPTSAQIRHFLGGNFLSSDSGRLTNSTPAISEFRQPTPPAGSDAHRYIFLLFRQPRNFNSQTLVTSTTPTSLFNISSFAAATGLGAPIAGTFMLVAPNPPA